MATIAEVTEQIQQTNVEVSNVRTFLENDAVIDSERDRNLVEMLSVSITDKIGELISFMQGDALAKIEQRREDRASQERVVGALEDLKADKKEEEEESLFDKLAEQFSDLGPILTPIAVAVGTVVGAVQGYGRSLRAIGATFSNLVKFLTKGSVDFQKAFATIVNGFRNFGARIKSLFSFKGIGTSLSSAVQSIRTFFSSALTRLNAIITPLKKGVMPVLKVFQSAVSQIRSLFSAVSSQMGAITKTLSTFGSTVGSVAKVASRLFAPLNFIFVGFQTIKGALDGFKEGGIFGALEGGIVGLLNGLIGIPLDLLKNAVAWIAGKLGFQNAQSVLDSFSFQNLFSSAVGAVFDLVGGVVDFVKKQFGFTGEGMPSFTDMILGLITLPADIIRSAASFIAEKLGMGNIAEFLEGFSFADIYRDAANAVSNVFTNIKDSFVDAIGGAGQVVGDAVGSIKEKVDGLFSGLLRAVLPDPSGDYGVFDPETYLLKIIPDSIYEKAGLDPDTGEIVDTPEEAEQAVSQVEGSDTGQQTGESLLQRAAEKRAEELRQKGEDLRRRAAGAEGSQTNVNAPTNISTSNSTVVKPLPSPSRVPNNSADLFYGAGA